MYLIIPGLLSAQVTVGTLQAAPDTRHSIHNVFLLHCVLVRSQAVVALITADVHNRDVVGSLVQKGTSSVNDFAWQMQLRFEYDPDADSILVRQTGAR